MRKIMASLDIGANALKLVVAETVGEKLNIIGVSTIPNNTIKKGKIHSRYRKNQCKIGRRHHNCRRYRIRS